MRKPRVSIIFISKRNSASIKEQLDKVLGDYIDFECLNYGEEDLSSLGSDLILASGNRAASSITNSVMNKTEILILRRTIKKKNYEKLKDIKGDSKILVVNDDQEMTDATISLLYELGLKNHDLVPYYPGCQYDKGSFDLAITPNEVRHVPYDVKEIINIGTRVIDSSTIFDILFKLNLINKSTLRIVYEYAKETILLSPSLEYLLNNINEEFIDYNQVMNNVDIGLILYDSDYNIIFYNTEINNIFMSSKTGVRRHSFSDLKKLVYDLNLENDFVNISHKINGRLHSITNKTFSDPHSIKSGGLITIKDFRNFERILSSIRNQPNKKSYTAKHTFEEIVGNSEILKKTKELAINFSKSDSPIMIQGESGTGKELFAQSIHNVSNKKDGPFIAFNCAALSESLIESELFGYESGAFTGASREGKIGLFELANEGTIFLDEIGDLPLNLQSKLLRVIQEGELMRVGGTEIIPIEVRIISATNKDLGKLVENSLFRSDLYYRLNVLPLYIQPFRERREDIKSLFEFFLNQSRSNKDITKAALNTLLDYKWPGNGREIHNCVQYISTIDKSTIDSDDLPRYINKDTVLSIHKQYGSEEREFEPWVYILKELRDAKRVGKKLGRRKLVDGLKKYSVFYTEAELRVILNYLKDNGYVEILQGRGGTQITESGISEIQGIL